MTNTKTKIFQMILNFKAVLRRLFSRFAWNWHFYYRFEWKVAVSNPADCL